MGARSRRDRRLRYSSAQQSARLALPASAARASAVGSRATAWGACLAGALGITGCGSLAAADAPVAPADLGLLQDAMRQVERSYVAPVKPDQLVDGALKGMLSKLDPHSDY